jgi:hypothetical protein
MLGSGTNAPLYASTFLNRADPEAELEAYERRLALAMDVDQADRILQHSPALARFHDTKSGGVVTHMKHTWRDSAWIKDGLATCLYSVAASRTLSHADNLFKLHIDHARTCEDLYPFYHSDTFLGRVVK